MRSLGVKGEDPRSIFRTLGVVRSRGGAIIKWCALIEGGKG
jgi:hypothetical protein